MAGFGCCTGGEGGSKFNLPWSSGFGSGESSQRGGGLGTGDISGDDDDDVPPCSPWVTPPLQGAFGVLPGEWPEWMAQAGCSLISILMHDERKYGKPKGSGPPVIYTLENANWMDDCIRKCSKGESKISGKGKKGQYNGLTTAGLSLDCWMKCKQEMMETKYSIAIKPKVMAPGPDLGGFGLGLPGLPKIPGKSSVSVLCPPLCIKTEVVLLIQWRYKIYLYTPLDGTKGPRPPYLYPHWKFSQTFGHAVRAKVVSCDPGKVVCFELQDYIPQEPRGGNPLYPKGGKNRLCMDGTGRLVWDPIPGLKNFGVHEFPSASTGLQSTLGPGECATCGRSIQCAQAYKNKPCFELDLTEQAGSGSRVVAIYLEDEKTSCDEIKDK